MEDYIKVLDIVEKSQGQHIGYEINVSCPNVKAGGMEFGINKDMVFQLTTELRRMTKKLLFIKLSPNVTNIEEIALSAESAGADAISAVNTFLGMAIDHKTGKFLLSTKFGGLSGPAIKPLALAKIYKIYNQINIPIIGMGGISGIHDIIEFLRVGSTMVQIGTLNYRDPSIICKFYDQLKSFMGENKINDISDLIGAHK
jgi:dihydroorotate dehydrogenase (NAD+) catalytic subunit